MTKIAKISAVAVFCDSIRQEISGQLQVLGIWPDNLQVPYFPGVLGTLCVYARVNFSPDMEIGKIILRLRPDGQETDLAMIESNNTELQGSIELSRKTNSPIAGYFLFLLLHSVQIPGPSRINAILDIDGESVVAGTLRIFADETAPSSAATTSTSFASSSAV